MGDTSIRISRRTKAQLDLHKREDESYDELLQRLTEGTDKWAGFGALAEADPAFEYDPEQIDELRRGTRERMRERIEETDE
ncbi:DUF7557 family protein [Natrarchaeobaculum aegyptiacum]|uniref:Sugar metabolism cluster protein n=1 Tax=Natrarchaeobaculum aegyptiacum TaxID=745377 RepID=A0A2Z2HZC7_9EURY|nr:sugar metabolism cluster protein [Natrarchaeobaculum aegyptiacum]ARS89048.1 sugar metabolism cluster protein [Natrarchaeobaculum aegyptiacum]